MTTKLEFFNIMCQILEAVIFAAKFFDGYSFEHLFALVLQILDSIVE